MKTLRYFTITEWSLWLFSILAILSTSIYFANQEPLAILASMIGITSLIFSAKGNPIGQGLIIIFAVIYAYLALRNNYYSELITYGCLTLPMAVFSLLSWLSHPFQGKKSQVTISQVKVKDYYLLFLLTVLITVIFYYILGIFHTPFLLVSTLSIATAFAGTFLTYKRSPNFALAYCLNDIILIALWLFEAQSDSSHYALVICFATFLISDIYTYMNWLRIHRLQLLAIEKKNELYDILPI